MLEAARHGWPVLGCDAKHRRRRRPAERAALIEAGVQNFILNGNVSALENVERVLHNLAAILAACTGLGFALSLCFAFFFFEVLFHARCGGGMLYWRSLFKISAALENYRRARDAPRAGRTAPARGRSSHPGGPAVDLLERVDLGFASPGGGDRPGGGDAA